MSESGEIRIDPHLGTVVHLVAARQHRPNLPADGCPFCVGGLEAPEPYTVMSFPNRWPALAPGRCEVVLYTPDHDASLATIGPAGLRSVIDLWADRTKALMAEPDVESVLVFENRGAEIGATIAHPHGQIYAFDHVPERQRRLLEASWRPDSSPGERLVTRSAHWQVVTVEAPVHPVSIDVSPVKRVPDLASMPDAVRDDLAHVLSDLMDRLDRLYGSPLPYMMWIDQAPKHQVGQTAPWMHIEIISPWRGPGLARFIAAAEVATGEYFNPVHPNDVAERLRALG